VTVLCLVERDGDGVADISLRALTFSRELAASEAQAGSATDGGAGSSVQSLAGSSPPATPAMSQPTALNPHDVTSNGSVAAAVFAPEAAVPATVLSAYGVTDAYAVESDLLVGYAPLAWARVLAELVTASSATAVVAAGTDHGNEIMAHLAAITGLPMAANCAAATRTPDGTYKLVRHRWAGSLLEDAALDASPALLTVAVDAVAAAPAAAAPAAITVHAYRPDLTDEDLAVVATESADRAGGVSLATARVVVGGGRGVGGPEGFGALEELAGLLGGALGVSRVVTSQGWRPHKQQVGQTGTRISPELYLACGISGAIQHMAGCLSAKHIVAVNTDPDAPIIAHADYAVIGDLNQVIPALVTALRARASSG
jgi:electron transfer flavoprotein alpha subunit